MSVEKRVVAFLQNAWSPVFAGRRWPRPSWLRALHASRTGQRLRVLVAHSPGVDWWWDNTTPIVGDSPSSFVPADPEHIAGVLRRQQPDVVVTLGRQAMVVVRPLCGQLPLLVLPHPTYRVVTNKLFERAGALLSEGFRGEVELRQDFGSVSCVRRLP